MCWVAFREALSSLCAGVAEDHCPAWALSKAGSISRVSLVGGMESGGSMGQFSLISAQEAHFVFPSTCTPASRES